MKIKFRVWDGTKFWRDVAIYDNSPYVWNYEETSLVPLFNQDQINLYGKPIIQRFTGLTDKNNKEIYEGDLVISSEETGVFEIKWEDVSALFLVGEELWPNARLTIIGNIFENPELLNEN